MKPGPTLHLVIGLGLILFGTLTTAATDPALPEEVEINDVSFILIPAGWFTYSVPNGAPFQGLPEGVPQYRHLRIWLDSYYIAKFEATAQDLARFMNSTQASAALKQQHVYSWSHGGEAEQLTGAGCTLTQDSQGRFVPANPDQKHPATYLSWSQADAFARWMGFRLPSDAEWQKAARGTDQRIWPWGDAYPDDTYALFSFGRACSPASVDAYPKGVSPYGLFNMAGNVSEHVAGEYNYAAEAKLQDGEHNPLPLQQEASSSDQPRKQIRHGGSWSSDPHSTPIAYRRYSKADDASNRYGVRFAVDTRIVSERLSTRDPRSLKTQHEH